MIAKRSLRVLAAALLAAGSSACSAAAPDKSPAQAGPRAEAIFAGGCFWCTESDFDKLPGVLATTSGYAGGTVRNPTYQQVSGGNSGHIEVVRIIYDPRRVSYATLVAHLLRTIDPVDRGGQFCDRGSQYRSAIFARDAGERATARSVIAKLQQQLKVPGPIVTEILPAATFYPAEGYHQDYYRKNPLRYRYYRLSCGRDARVKQVWGTLAAH